MGFVNIQKQEFDELLGVSEEIEGKEFIYLLPTDKESIRIKIYSSIDIRTNVSRELAKDAIRVTLFDTISQKGIGKGRYTQRTDGWQSRLTTKVDELRKRVINFNYCSECGAVVLYGRCANTECPTSKVEIDVENPFTDFISLSSDATILVKCYYMHTEDYKGRKKLAVRFYTNVAIGGQQAKLFLITYTDSSGKIFPDGVHKNITYQVKNPDLVFSKGYLIPNARFGHWYFYKEEGDMQFIEERSDDHVESQTTKEIGEFSRYGSINAVDSRTKPIPISATVALVSKEAPETEMADATFQGTSTLESIKEGEGQEVAFLDDKDLDKFEAGKRQDMGIIDDESRQSIKAAFEKERNQVERRVWIPIDLELEVAQPMGEHNTPRELIKSACLKDLINIPFKYLNPPQTDAIKHLNEDCNIIIASPTGSGKTLCAIIHAAKGLKQGGKIGWLSPMKALTEEKFDEFTETFKATFGDFKIEKLTGDYTLTEEKKRSLSKADIILMTTEALNARCRLDKSEHNQFLRDFLILIVDEFHIIHDKERGSHEEAGLINFTEINKSAQLIALSATAGTEENKQEFKNWFELLNEKPTYLIVSDYRPVELEKHWVSFQDCNWYNVNESKRREKAIEIIRNHPDDKFLVFVGNKKCGRSYLKDFAYLDIEAEFHNANLSLPERKRIEDRFKNEDLKVLIASPTLIMGINIPARRLIMTHTSYGLEPMAPYSIHQAIGRSGRPGLDPRGDAYIILPESEFELEKSRIETPQYLESALTYIDNLQFHFVALVHNKQARNINELRSWYERSFANTQGNMDEFIFQKVVDDLIRFQNIKERNGSLESLPLGKIATWLYFAPRITYQWAKNFREYNNYEMDDKEAAFLFCKYIFNTDGYISKAEKEVVQILLGSKFTDEPSEKYVAAAFARLKGLDEQDGCKALYHIARGLIMDSERCLQAMKMISSNWLHIGAENFLDVLALRLRYGVSKELVELVKMKGIGKARALKLSQIDILNKNDLIENQGKAIKLLGKKIITQAIQEEN